jgi:hypothetical protein
MTDRKLTNPRFMRGSLLEDIILMISSNRARAINPLTALPN